MTKNEVLTLRVERSLGDLLSENADLVGLTRADYLRLVLRAASKIDPKLLLTSWEAEVQSQLLRKLQ